MRLTTVTTARSNKHKVIPEVNRLRSTGRDCDRKISLCG